MDDTIAPIMICAMIFIGMPWIFFHYSLQFRKAKGITVEDENLLDDLHDTARRLHDRLESIERIIAADNPGWKDGALGRTADRIADRTADRSAARSTDRLADAEPRLSVRR